MGIQESNAKKFFAWVKTKVTMAQYQEMQKMKVVIPVMLVQKNVIKQFLFYIENADEVEGIINSVAQCFASDKVKDLAVQMVTLYVSFLKENKQETDEKEIKSVKQQSSIKSNNKFLYKLYVGETEYRGESPAIVFVEFCEVMAITYPLKIRSLIGLRLRLRADVPLKKINNGNCIKMKSINAYVNSELQMHHVEDYVRWICDMCAIKLPNISISVDQSATVVDDVELISDGINAAHLISDTAQDATVIAQDSSEIDKKAAVKMIAHQNPKRSDPLLSKMEQIILSKDMEGISYDDLKDRMQITMVLTKQLVTQSTKIADIKGILIHEEAFIDWEDGADALEAIIEKLMQKNNGYVSSAQLFEYARIEMNMFLNDNDMREERAVYDMAQHLFEKAHYHGKNYIFRGKIHISRTDAGIGSNMDVYKKYAIDQGGVFSFNGLVEYLESIGVGIGNLRMQMRMTTEPIFFFYDHDLVVYAEALHIDDAWKKSIANSLQVLFDDAGDHMILRNIPAIWFDQLPAIPGTRPWTPLLLQSVLRFFNKELGARTIQALDGQSLETVHTMLVANDSPIQNFGDVIISYMLEQNVERRKFEAEELRMLLVDGGILHGNELIWNMPKALKRDGRFAWDASGNQVTVKI